MSKKNICQIKLNQIEIKDLFWSEKQKLVTDVVIPYQEKILDDKIPNIERSHAFANFRIAAGLEDGEFYGMVFQDSDVAKWLEAVAYSLCIKPDEKLEKRADKVIETIEKAQQEDGYLNTYFTIKEPRRRWTNLHECHELYCAGHMMEAAVAYYEATGKDKLLHVMERMAEHIRNVFSKELYHGVPGHQEIEIGLMRLYHTTKNSKYKELAEYFIDERGKDPFYFLNEFKKRGWKHEIMDPYDNKYNQSFAPVREQEKAEGHCVRAVYMYTAMADLAAANEDESLFNACNVLWNNMVNSRMYITGGIGSTAQGEAFTVDYDLPNDTVYAETCASVGLIFFAKKMLEMFPSNQYADVMERALYNGVISGMQLDGKNFFYVNPLEVNPEVSGVVAGYKHVLSQRPEWYKCACCPPNVARLLTSLGSYAWGESEDTIYSHLYIGGSAKLSHATVYVTSDFPWKGKILYIVEPKKEGERFTLAIRIPSYAKRVSVLLNGKKINIKNCTKEGYTYVKKKWEKSDQVEVLFDMPVRKIYTNTMVRENIDCVALMRGPLVYCFEGIDNGENLQELHIPQKGKIEVCDYDVNLLKGIIKLEMEGIRTSFHKQLYYEGTPKRERTILKAVPYYAWGNRGLNQMRVWMHEDGSK